MVGSLGIVVDDDHVEQVTPACLHVAGGGDNLFEIVLLSTMNGKAKLTHIL